MKKLFTPAGRRALAKQLSGPCLLIFDFDGVLAPLVDDRNAAIPAPSTRKLLTALARRAPIAVVTGRGRKDVLGRLEIRPRYTAGNHGIEGLAVFRERLRQARRLTARWSRDLRLDDSLKQNGVDIEDKTLSLTLHYREAGNRPRARKAILAAAARLTPPPHLVLGKMVVNFVPEASPHKGDAARAILKHSRYRRAIFVGDDRTDENVFQLQDPRILGIRVGYRSGSAAEWFIGSQKETDRLLRELIALIAATGPG